MYDAARTEYLKQHGYTVIRFDNEDVESNLQVVLATIYRIATTL